MESKNLRPNVLSSEIKPSKSDLNSSAAKLQSRNGKKRENGVVPKTPTVGTSTGPVPSGFKNQKPWLSKQKASDKKQQRNVGLTGSGAYRKNDYQVTDSNDPDLDLVLSETGKKQNLAHLLNMKFQFAPRDTTVSSYWRATHTGKTGEKSRKFNYYSGRAHLNKDHYLQANCQFVVKADGDYTVYLADPDLLVPWESIEQIRIWGSEVGSCPICLHPPVAAKMTRCGHIYCWPCILHFLALSDKTSRPCPICDVSIRIQDLKSVVALEQRSLKIGDVLEMRLMKRDRHSLIPQTVSHSKGQRVASKQKPSYLGKAGEDHVFSKLLLCTPNEVVDLILHWEKIELQTQLETEKDCPESCFIQQALELLEVRERNTAVDCLSSFAAELELDAKENTTAGLVETGTCVGTMANDNGIVTDGSEGFKRYRNASVSSDGTFDQTDIQFAGSFSVASCTASNQENFASQVTDTHNNQQKNVFYFYQSSDGQAIYLHPMNVQILVRCYGSLELCPETIQGRIIEAETLSMTEELRNRLRYLGHIPVSKQFQIMEILLTEPPIELDILEEFRERIDERARRRRRKDREERRRELEIQRAEDAKWGRTKSQPIVRLDSQVHFPGFSPNSLEQPELPKIDDDVSRSYETAPSSSIEYSGQQSSGGPSFAQMLREGKNKIPLVWSPLPSRETKTVKSALSLNKPGFRNASESETENADYTPVPEYKETFSTALAAAFDQAAKSKDAYGKTDPDHSKKKNKKKIRQKVLFSTGMNFM